MSRGTGIIENGVFSLANPATPTKSYITFHHRFHLKMKTVFLYSFFKLLTGLMIILS